VEWLPANQLVFFRRDLASRLDLSAIHAVHEARDPRGAKAYEPRLMVVLLLYAYCVGMPSSRRIERACSPQLINQRHHQGSDRWRHRRPVAIGNSSRSGRVISNYLMLRERLWSERCQGRRQPELPPRERVR
jgi:hypothetical protein